jgi:acetyl-CoA carboxylase carboxyltransferase component
MSWEREIEEIRRRERLAREMGGAESVARHHAGGKLTVRERIGALLDRDTFHETGALAGRATYDEQGRIQSFRPSNFVFGTGLIGGRRVVVGGDDFTVRGGAQDGAVGNKMGYCERMAQELLLPLVRLVDGTGGGGSVRTLEKLGATYVPAIPGLETSVELMGLVPVVGAAMGSVAGLGAMRVAASHFRVMVRGTSQVFVAGPPVVERGVHELVTKEELGGAHVHGEISGLVDYVAADEHEAFAAIRCFFSYLPQNVYEQPPVRDSDDDPARREAELVSIIPRERRHAFDVRRLCSLVLDRDSLFEVGALQGRSLVTAFGRLDGHPVGVMANDPMQGGGGLDGPGADKMVRFVDFCDAFHVPVVNFVDNPGFLIGTEAERTGTILRGTRALFAVYQARVPWCSILLRRCFGVAGAGHGNADRLNLRYAWPSADWGSLPIEGGVMAAYKREIEAHADPEARRREIEAMLDRVRSPFRTAEMFGIEEIIDPRDTRRLLCDWIGEAYRIESTRLGARLRSMRP